MVGKVPSLSVSGWIDEIGERADKLMAYYLTSDYSQSELYAGNVVSLQYHIEQHGSDEGALRTQVESDLRRYLERYFESADITVTTDRPIEGDENRIHLRLECFVVSGGQRYSLGKLITAVNSKVIDIIDINNG